MSYSIELTRSAEQDLTDIYDYVYQHDCLENAHLLLDELLALVTSLTEQPSRGSFPKELSQLGIKEYRQVLFKPYRIIYRQINQRIIIYLIADGRRDFRSLLEQRLLR